MRDNIQRRLLSEPRLDFKKAMELALGLETAVKNARELQSSGREFASTEGANKLADSGDSEAANRGPEDPRTRGPKYLQSLV